MGIDLSPDDAPSTSHYTFDAHGNILGFFGEIFQKGRESEDGGGGRFIHLPRQMLRKRLLDHVAPASIRWQSKVQDFALAGGATSAPAKAKAKDKAKAKAKADGGAEVPAADSSLICPRVGGSPGRRACCALA